MESIQDNHDRRHSRRLWGSYWERGKVQTGEKKVRAKTLLDFFHAPTNCPTNGCPSEQVVWFGISCMKRGIPNQITTSQT